MGVGPVARKHGVNWQTADKIREAGKLPKHQNGLNNHALPKDIASRIAARFLDDDRPSDDRLAVEFAVSRSVIRRIRAKLASGQGRGRGDRLDASEATRVHIADKDELGRQRTEMLKLHRRISEIEDLRSGILGLGEPAKPRLEKRPPKGKPGTRSAILHLSDLHYAEAIDLAEMGGINSYNVEIADNRLNRSFNTVARLLTEFWHGQPVERIHICLGGDLVSGGIHPELVRTDELLRLPSAKAVAARLADGILGLRKEVGVPISIYSVPGNHGRLTVKPETKAHVPDNLDTLVAWFIESRLAKDDGVKVMYGDSVDCLFDVYGLPFVLTHGDRMGSRGGQGFIGPVATIMRGHHKLLADYSSRGTPPYKVLTGHFHTTCEMPSGYGNGSLAGWSNFARDLRAQKEQAQQNFLIVHSERGVIDVQRIMPGVPEEGSIYRGRQMNA